MIDDVPQIKLAFGQHKEGIKFRHTLVIAYFALKAKVPFGSSCDRKAGCQSADMEGAIADTLVIDRLTS